MRETGESDTSDSRDMSVTFKASSLTDDDNKVRDEDEETCLEYHLPRKDNRIDC